MSSNKHEGNENNLSLDKVENYVQDNKKSLTIIVGAAVLIVVAYFSYTNFILGPQEEKAQNVHRAKAREVGTTENIEFFNFLSCITHFQL
jgi:hypothetical protein